MYGSAGLKPYETPDNRISSYMGNSSRGRMPVFGFVWRVSLLVAAAVTAAGIYVSWKMGDPSPLMAAGITGVIVLIALRLLRPSGWPSPNPVVAFFGGVIIAAAVAVPVVAFADDEDTLFPGQDLIENAVLDVRESFRNLNDADEWQFTEEYIRSEIRSRTN